jgi:RNA polymerase sigma-70 factor (ECF subfamily)
MVEHLSDEELMRRCAGGDRSAFDVIAGRYRPRMVAMARQWLGSSESADDAAQEVLIAAFEHHRQFEARGPFASWLFALAANHLRSLYRAQQRRRGALGLTDELPRTSAFESVAADASVLWDALGGLPPNQRACLLLHDLYGFDHGEIAGLFGVAAGTARSWTSRARAEVRRRLDASDFTHRRMRR